MLENGKLGRLFELHNVNAMADAIKETVGQKDKVEEASLSLHKHDFTNVANAYIKTLEQAFRGD